MVLGRGCTALNEKKVCLLSGKDSNIPSYTLLYHLVTGHRLLRTMRGSKVKEYNTAIHYL